MGRSSKQFLQNEFVSYYTSPEIKSPDAFKIASISALPGKA